MAMLVGGCGIAQQMECRFASTGINRALQKLLASTTARSHTTTTITKTNNLLKQYQHNCNKSLGQRNFSASTPLSKTNVVSNKRSMSSSSETSASKGAETTSATTTTNTSSSVAATAKATGTTTPKQHVEGTKSFMEWYEGHLNERPVITKMITGAFLWGVGDAVAQVVPRLTDRTSPTSSWDYDWPRTARAVIFGFGIHAPTAHVHYNFLEWLTVKAGVTGMSIPIFKAVLEQFVYWSWFSNSMYHAAMGAMQGRSPEQIYQRLVDVLWETQKAQWVFWIPIQLLNFQFVPVRHQLNVVLLTSIVWTALLSAWYPPENDDDGNQKVEKNETN